jgi:hypothetical protein
MRRGAGVSASRIRAISRKAFERYSFDLIYARPQQTPDAWAIELKRAIAEAAEHLSLYQLTIEQDTPFAALRAAGKLVIPDDDTARALYDTTQEICTDAGLPAYEVSNHARPGAQCRHNLVYWRMHEYAGIGPGAHGRLDIAGVRHAIATEKRPEAWLMRVPGFDTLRVPARFAMLFVLCQCVLLAFAVSRWSSRLRRPQLAVALIGVGLLVDGWARVRVEPPPLACFGGGVCRGTARRNVYRRAAYPHNGTARRLAIEHSVEINDTVNLGEGHAQRPTHFCCNRFGEPAVKLLSGVQNWQECRAAARRQRGE